MMKRRVGLAGRGAATLLLSGLAVVAMPELAQAQGAGAIGGRVVDATGAVMPGVTITAIHGGTDAVSATISTASGYYALVNLRPGRYRVTAVLSGFEAPVRTEVVVNVETRSAVDFTLSPAGRAETVTVEGASSLVDRLSPAVGTVVDRQFLENLPLNGRSFQTCSKSRPV